MFIINIVVHINKLLTLLSVDGRDILHSIFEFIGTTNIELFGINTIAKSGSENLSSFLVIILSSNTFVVSLYKSSTAKVDNKI